MAIKFDVITLLLFLPTFWLFAPKFWEVVGTYELLFCQKDCSISGADNVR